MSDAEVSGRPEDFTDGVLGKGRLLLSAGWIEFRCALDWGLEGEAALVGLDRIPTAERSSVGEGGGE